MAGHGYDGPSRRPPIPPPQLRTAGAAHHAGPPAGADPARAAALELLTSVRERDAYANLALPAILRRARLSGRDAALATELGYGTCRAVGLLDAVIAACANRRSAGSSRRCRTPCAWRLQLLRTRIPRTPRSTPRRAGALLGRVPVRRVRERHPAPGRRAHRGRVGGRSRPGRRYRPDRAPGVPLRPPDLDRPGVRRRPGRLHRGARKALAPTTNGRPCTCWPGRE